jgi:hypothetical protein
MYSTPTSSQSEVLTEFQGKQETLKWRFENNRMRCEQRFQGPVQGSFIDKQGPVSSNSLSKGASQTQFPPRPRGEGRYLLRSRFAVEITRRRKACVYNQWNPNQPQWSKKTPEFDLDLEVKGGAYWRRGFTVRWQEGDKPVYTDNRVQVRKNYLLSNPGGMNPKLIDLWLYLEGFTYQIWGFLWGLYRGKQGSFIDNRTLIRNRSQISPW